MVWSLQGYCSYRRQVRFPFPPSFLQRHHTPTLFPIHTNKIFYNRFSETFPGAHFVKIDVDEVPDVAQELGIRAMPTFVIFKDGEKIQDVVGANPKALEAAIQAATSA